MFWLLACTSTAPVVAEPALFTHQRFPTAAAAFQHILDLKPQVLGIGEVHANTEVAAGPSTLQRFTTELLPLLAPTTTDIVLETWRINGDCRQKATEVSQSVQSDTHRPEATKSELEILIERADALHIKPHDLAVSCAEYAAIQTPEGDVDYNLLLKTITSKLYDYAIQGFETPKTVLVIYGGAVHNDALPPEETAEFSYGKALVPRGYIELDIFDPVILRSKPRMVEDTWAPLLNQTGPNHVLLYARSPNSYVMLLESPATP